MPGMWLLSPGTHIVQKGPQVFPLLGNSLLCLGRGDLAGCGRRKCWLAGVNQCAQPEQGLIGRDKNTWSLIFHSFLFLMEL